MNEKTVYLVIYDKENNYETFMYDNRETAIANTIKILTEQGYFLVNINHFNEQRSTYKFVCEEPYKKVMAILEKITIRNFQDKLSYVASIMETTEEPYYSIEVYTTRKFAHNKVRKLFLVFLTRNLDKFSDKELRNLIQDFGKRRSESFYIPQLKFSPSVVLRTCRKQF